MIDVSHTTAPCPVRADIEEAHTLFWQKLAAPGMWWTGTERVAIGAEVRQARHYQPCQERKAALSPTAIQGTHDTGGVLPETTVEMIHRVKTDPGRLSKRRYDERSCRVAPGMSSEYVRLHYYFVTCSTARHPRRNAESSGDTWPLLRPPF